MNEIKSPQIFISIDPGLDNLGIAVFTNLLKDQFIEGSQENLRKFGGLPAGRSVKLDLLTRAVIKFVESGPYHLYFTCPNLGVILEINDVLATRHLPALFSAAIMSINPYAEIFCVHPMNVAGFFKVKGTPKMTRPQKKKQTIERMNSYYRTNKDPKISSPDIADAMQNFLYIRLRVLGSSKQENPFKHYSNALLDSSIDETLGISEDECQPSGTGEAETDRIPS